MIDKAQDLTSNVRRVAAFSALAIAAMPLYFVIPRLIGTLVGAQNPAGEAVSAQIAQIIAYPAVYASLGLASVLVGLGFIVLALALHELLRAGTRLAGRMATAAGVIGGSMFFLAGFGPLTVSKWLTDVHAQDPAAATSLYVTFQSITDAHVTTATMMFGAFVVLASFLGVRAKLWGRALAFVGIAVGTLYLVGLFLPSVWFVPALLMLVWAAWLGIAMLRSDRSPAPEFDERRPAGI